MICRMRHRPRREPKFHQDERLIGAGRSTRAVFRIFRMGFDLRRGLNILSEWAKGTFIFRADFYNGN